MACLELKEAFIMFGFEGDYWKGPGSWKTYINLVLDGLITFYDCEK